MCFVQNKPKAEVLFVLSDLINSKAESQASAMKKKRSGTGSAKCVLHKKHRGGNIIIFLC